MKDLVKLFIDEVDRIDKFFNEKIVQYKKAFKELKRTFKKKNDQYDS